MLDLIDPQVLGGSVAVAIFFGILLFLAIGRWIGRRLPARGGTSQMGGVGSLEAAVFALLGLMIAFTLSGALTRFDNRRLQVVDEANAIGTAYLRLDVLPVAAQAPLRDLFRQYVDARIAVYSKLPDVSAARQELARSEKLQNEIWTQALSSLRAVDAQPSAAVLVVPALNQMFDISSTRAAATMIHPPTIIYAMLIALALASALLAGYQSAKAIDPMHRFGFATIIAVTIYVIIEVEYPRLGLVRLDAVDQLLVNVRAGM